MKRMGATAILAVLLAFGVTANAEDTLDGITDSSASTRLTPQELTMRRAGDTQIDLRQLPLSPPKRQWREEREPPPYTPRELPGGPEPQPLSLPRVAAPAPSPSANFAGLDFLNWGAGRPPDTVGDVGPTYFIQAVNSSVGIYRKSDGVRLAAFTFNTLMSQGAFGNLCDTNNFGDPVVLYDTMEDRWVLTDFAFTLDGSNNVINPPGAFQCFAVSKTGDPLTGGWNFYSLQLTDALNDYPKFGVWPDGIYMSANMFAFPAGGSFQGTRVWAFNKAQMYAGAPSVQIVTFNPPGAEFTLLPANARLQTGTPPAGAPNYFSVVWQFTNAISVYKFHVDWDRVSLSSFTGPFTALAPASWASPPSTVPAQSGTAIDTLPIRLMMQNQYTNISGVESLWNVHTVRHPTTTGVSSVRYYQVTVTGGAVAATTTQAATHAPDTTIHRMIPSLAVNRAGDMALMYSATNSTMFPAIRYVGRLATDPLDTLPQTETSLIEGTGSQNTSSRWGDYAAMTLDPDGCTFWMTSEYYAAVGGDWQTRIGSFRFPSCVSVGNGALSGTITATAGGAPIANATVRLGSRTTTTNGAGQYSFATLPAGTYPTLSVSANGFVGASTVSVPVAESATTTRDFALDGSSANACLVDTTTTDFQTGVGSNIDLATSPDNVILLNAPSINQQNSTLGTSGVGVTITTWGGQTFTPSVTGQMTRADISMFCSGCTGTTPNLTLSLRATSGGLPTGADLASATIAGFSAGSTTSLTATFSPAPTLTAGTQYALVIRPTANPSPGTYALTRSGTATTGADVYAGGTRVSGATSGTVWSIPLTGGINTDTGFKIYVQTGFAASGQLTSGLKDANPPSGDAPGWASLAWNATVPGSTTLRFQAAAANSVDGPFNFVGPDGTAGTFFTSGASLTQFNGNRYLKYKALLTTSDSAVTPSLADVTTCYAALTPPELSLSKSDGDVSVSPGGTVAYTLSYANNGGQIASGVVITEQVPANATFNAGASTAGWSCTPNNNAGATCTLSVPNVIGAGSGTATFAVTAVNPVATGVTQLSNTASIANDGTHGADPVPGNNSASDTTPIDAAPDLSLSKSDGGASIAPGGTVTYTLTFANDGNQDATGVVLAETVPANTSFNAGASSAGWTCAPNNNAGATCSLAIGALAASANGTRAFAVTVINPVAAGVTQITNNAMIADDAANGGDPTPGNNTAGDTTPVNATPDLSLTKSDGGASTTPGGTVIYTLSFGNAGNQGATGVTLTETVPAESTFNAGASSGGWTCAPNGNAGSTCTRAIGALAAGANGNALFAVTVNSPVSGGVTQLSNTASIADDGANGADPTPANNTGSDTTPITATADLSVTLTGTPDPVIAGNAITYTLSVNNAGPSTATTVSVTQQLPANATFVSLAAPGGWSCTTPAVGSMGSVTCTNPSLAIGSASFTAVARVNPETTGIQSVSSANVSSTTSDSNTGNNAIATNVSVIRAADLSVTISDSPDPVTQNGAITYAIQVVNAGPSTASSVRWTATTAPGTTFTSLSTAGDWVCSTPAVGASGVVTCARGIFGVPATENFTLVTTVNGALTGGTVITQPISVTQFGTDPVPGNDTASTTTTVSGAPTISVLSPVSTNEDTVSIPVPITISDAETPLNALTLTAASSNQLLVSDTSLANGLGGSGGNRTLTITPEANAFGTTTITLSVTDGDANTTNATLSLTVHPINDAPTFTLAGNRQHPSASTGAQTVPGFATAISAGPPNESGQTLSFGVSESADANNVVSGAAIASNGTLTYTLTGATGTATLRATLFDNGGTTSGGVDTSAPASFKIVVGAGVDLTTRITRTQPPNLPLTNPSNGGATLANYAITVTNNGTVAVSGVTLSVPTIAGLTGVLWTCSVTSGSCVPSNGSGLPSATVNLGVGDIATLQANGTINTGATFVRITAVATTTGAVVVLNPDDDRDDLFEPVATDGVFADEFE